MAFATSVGAGYAHGFEFLQVLSLDPSLFLLACLKASLTLVPFIDMPIIYVIFYTAYNLIIYSHYMPDMSIHLRIVELGGFLSR